MSLEKILLAVITAIGVPSIFIVIYRAVVNKLEEQFVTRKDFVALKAEMDGEMARLATLAQNWMLKQEETSDSVKELVIEERHNRLKIDKQGNDLEKIRGDLSDFKIDHSRQLGVFRDELKNSLDRSLKDMLPQIERIVRENTER